MKMPKEITVYVYDYDEDGTPILAVANSVEDISEDHENKKVGIYTLNRTATFRVKRELK